MTSGLIVGGLFLAGSLAQPVPAGENSPPPTETEEPGETGADAGDTSHLDKFFFGGGIGLGFGDIDYVELWPLLGYNFHPEVRGGLTLTYRYRKDDRFPQEPSTSDYGGSLFVDYFPLPRFFLRGEYEHLNYEFINFDLTTDREGFNSVLGGVGFASSISPNGTLDVMVLYNFSYDSDDPYSPYEDPYVFRIGVSYGF